MKDCRIVKADCVGSSICILDTRMCQCVHVYLCLCVCVAVAVCVCVCAMGISIQDTYNMHLYNFNQFYTCIRSVYNCPCLDMFI